MGSTKVDAGRSAAMRLRWRQDHEPRENVTVTAAARRAATARPQATSVLLLPCSCQPRRQRRAAMRAATRKAQGGRRRLRTPSLWPSRLQQKASRSPPFYAGAAACQAMKRVHQAAMALLGLRLAPTRRRRHRPRSLDHELLKRDKTNRLRRVRVAASACAKRRAHRVRHTWLGRTPRRRRRPAAAR